MLLCFGSGKTVIVSAVAKTWINHFYMHMVINWFLDGIRVLCISLDLEGWPLKKNILVFCLGFFNKLF